ncbi:MAG: hypothetical protein J5814_01790 [Bacteroidaceae bacterium]|nr:hypothetical protein [Bacteroidaceae bacterium]
MDRFLPTMTDGTTNASALSARALPRKEKAALSGWNCPCVLLMFLTSMLLFSCHPKPDTERERLLATLDNTLAHKNEYIQRRQAYVDSLKHDLQKASTDSARYSLSLQLADEYTTLMCDSALAYALQSRRYANETGDIYRQQESDIRIIKACSNAGMFIDVWNLVPLRSTADCLPDHRPTFCWAMISLYEHMRSYYAGNEEQYEHFNHLTLLYRDTLMQILPENSGLWLKEKAFSLQAQGHYDEALRILLPLYEGEEPGTRSYGLNAMSRARLYLDMGDTAQAITNLAASADMDVRYGVRENEALLALSKLMYAQGDYSRAYRYATAAIEDAEMLNSRFRFTEVTGIYRVIKESYLQQLNRHEQFRLRLILALLAALGVLLFGIIMLTRAHRKLSIARHELHETVDELADANLRLDDAARVREYYITHLITASSTYANKLEDFRKAVNRKLKTRQYDDLLAQTSRPHSDDLDTVYEQFDKTFLALYPTFVDDLNALLEPAHRYPREGRNLCTEQRIFALIRLGMTDVGQIANFLHYSTQTIYNYKHRVKNHALRPEDFERDVMLIGQM